MGSERERGQVGPVPEETGEQPTPGGDPREFLRLVSEARGASDDERARLVGELNDVLVAMRAPGNERAEAKAVLGQLDLKSLTGLVDAQGRSARAEAVQTVLTLGFPYALEVTPQDLEFARAQERSDVDGTLSPGALRTLDLARKATVAIAGFSAVGQGVLLTQHLAQVDATVLAAASATAAGGWALWMANRVGKRKRDLVQGTTGMGLGLAAMMISTQGLISPEIGLLGMLPLIAGIVALAASRAGAAPDER